MNKMMTQTNNFDVQQLVNMIGQTTMNISNISNQLGIVATAVNTLTTDVDGIKNDISQLKLNEEVTTTQQEAIIETAQKRICEIIGNDELERKKYFRIFVQKLYKDTRQNAGLGSKISRTRTGDFQ